MKTFKIIATRIEYAIIEIEAYDADEAWDKAGSVKDAEWCETGEATEWEPVDIEQIWE